MVTRVPLPYPSLVDPSLVDPSPIQMIGLLVASPPFLLSLLEAQGMGVWFGKLATPTYLLTPLVLFACRI